MIGLFWFFFLGTGIVVRALTPPLHFRNKTITHKIRSKTGKNIHHLHIGVIFTFLATIVIILHGINKPLLFVAALGLSLIADQIFIISDFSDYFNKKGLFMSILGHLIVGLIATLFLLLVF
ncbi:MAG: hypothetical protein QXW97_00435 [Candidatus Pacearchaeota archaeon]